MTEHALELWNLIAKFEFDQPTTKFTFAKRLAEENGFTRQFADEIIEEYRKFIFLCCVSKGEIAPSYFVDQAWHLHLTYTRSYWIDLCQNTIGRDLHHNPTQGGPQEDRKYKCLYKGTKALYKQYFRSDPPMAIWPNQHTDPRQARVEADKNRNWVIPKPNLHFWTSKTVVSIAAVVLSALFLGGCTSYGGPVPIALGLVLVFGVFSWLFKKDNKRNRSGSGSSGYGSSIFDASGCSGDSSDAVNCDSTDSSDCSDSGGDSGGGDSGCSSGCGGGCGGGGD